MSEDEVIKGSQSPIKQKLTVDFRENGDPKGRTLKEFLETAPIGTEIKIGNKTLVKKTT